ncbi:Ger(x)C family spore germination protein [Brevibacillus panacihumi]|uniref:Ger(x)C family spore germination protein n=1 Tax=Brevibacillus panacihumi TaxID=497735 RepID=UPI003D1A895C
MDRRWSYLCLLLLCLSFLAGCWDRRELEERASVLAIAIDAGGEDEERYRVTVQIPIPIKIAGSSGQGGGGNSNAVKVMSVTGRTITDATNNLQLRLNQRLFLGHTRVVAISEEIAREGIADILDGFRREALIRRLLWPIIVRGKASSLLEIKPELAQIPVVFIMDLVENGRKMGTIPDKTLGDYLNEISNKSMQPFLNYVEATKREVKWIGTAIFHDHKMVGSLTPIETWSLLQLRDQKRGGDVIMPLAGEEDAYVTLRPRFVDTNLTIRPNTSKGGGLEAVFACEVQGDIMEYVPGHMRFASPEEFIRVMQKELKQELEKRAKHMVTKLKKHNSDILKLGLHLRSYHFRDYWSHHDWNKAFKDFPIRVEYTIKLRRLGMEMQQ